MSAPAADRSETIRVFADYADEAMWFVGGPVDYDESRVSASLARAMTAWARSYEVQLDNEVNLIEGPGLDAFRVEGERLAHLLMAELGDAFEVEYRYDDPRGKLRGRGVGAGSNPDAVAAFRTIAAEEAELTEQIRAMVDAGDNVGWTAEGVGLRRGRLFGRRRR